jgi:aspartyl/asparaginyl beta-hydroxylase (cupin superfamily)
MPEGGKRMQGLINITLKRLEQSALKFSWLEDLVGKFSLVGDSVFFTKEQFPWSQDLEDNWLTIRKELDAIMNLVNDLPNYQDISSRQSNITNDDRWKTYFFSAFGYKVAKNCERCPETTKILEKIPGLKVAFFSIFAPHKRIPEHRGKHKGLIRCHLGLIVPEPKSACGIRIGDRVAHWEEGKTLLFDDTFLHEAWNDTDGYRVVLFLDIARPLAFPMSLVNWIASQLISRSDMIKEAKINHENWEKRFKEVNSE